MNDAITRAGMRLKVTAVGSRCPLDVGEIVTTTGTYTFDFLGGGDIVAFEVKRDNGLTVTISRGPAYGAQFEPQQGRA